jgi:hypothetical protein
MNPSDYEKLPVDVQAALNWAQVFTDTSPASRTVQILASWVEGKHPESKQFAASWQSRLDALKEDNAYLRQRLNQQEADLSRARWEWSERNSGSW